nr:DNA-directed RNA polymerase III subunit RPC8 [Tanacetum cinerariifolium]
MFNLTKFEYTLSLSLEEAVKGDLESLFFDKVIANLGLCISLYDIESIYGGFIFANDGAPSYITEDIPDIIATACSSCLKFLYALAANRLDENTDII